MAKKSKIAKFRNKQKFSVQHHNRCLVCGRPRGYFRFFKMCRVCLRKYAHEGVIPGLYKASW